jgi:hypothetical protein
MKTNYTVQYVTPTNNQEARAFAKMLADFGATDIQPDDRAITVTWSTEEQERLFDAALEREIMKQLIHVTSHMITALRDQAPNKIKESAETGMLRTHLVALVGELQKRGVLPHNFHVNEGVAVWHLPESPYDE